MSVTGQILEHLFRPAEGPFGVNDPLFDLADLVAQSLKGLRLRQRFQFAVELEFAVLEVENLRTYPCTTPVGNLPVTGKCSRRSAPNRSEMVPA